MVGGGGVGCISSLLICLLFSLIKRKFQILQTFLDIITMKHLFCQYSNEEESNYFPVVLIDFQFFKITFQDILNPFPIFMLRPFPSSWLP